MGAVIIGHVIIQIGPDGQNFSFSQGVFRDQLVLVVEKNIRPVNRHHLTVGNGIAEPADPAHIHIYLWGIHIGTAQHPVEDRVTAEGVQSQLPAVAFIRQLRIGN